MEKCLSSIINNMNLEPMNKRKQENILKRIMANVPKRQVKLGTFLTTVTYKDNIHAKKY